MQANKRVLLIANPNSGKKAIQQKLFFIIEELTNNGCTVTVQLTKYRAHATEIVAALHQNEYDMVICSGGDGTLNEVISGLILSGSNIPLGYIPAGSTNDFATTLGLSSDMVVASRDAVTSNVHCIDIGKFQDRYFSYVASFGIFTKASYATKQKTKNLLGSAAYILEGIKDIANVHEYGLKIEADGRVIDDTFIFGAIANSTSLGGIITIDPNDVALDDGVFEYLFVKKTKNTVDLIKAISAIKSYNYNSDLLYFGSAKHIVVHTDGGLDWSLDGEYAHTDSCADIVNIHNAVQLALPNRKKGRNLVSDINGSEENN